MRPRGYVTRVWSYPAEKDAPPDRAGAADDCGFCASECIWTLPTIYLQRTDMFDGLYRIWPAHTFGQSKMAIYLWSNCSPVTNCISRFLCQYCVDKLKSLCEEYLASRLCHQTVLDILVLANSCDSDYLKKHAIEYIKLWVYFQNKLCSNCVFNELFIYVFYSDLDTTKPSFAARNGNRFLKIGLIY